MSHDPRQIKISEQVTVARTDVAAAKSFILGKTKNEGSTGEDLITAWLENVGYSLPKKIDLTGNDENQVLSRVARHLSLRLAASYAIWELCASLLLFPSGATLDHEPLIEYQEPGLGSSWRFPDLKYTLPQTVRAPARSYLNSMLVDGDLYLTNLSLPNLHPGIERALRDAVTCFRYDMFNASAAMLGAAAEGAWVELALSLGNAIPTHFKVTKALDEVNGQRSMPRVLKYMTELLEDKSLCGQILANARVTLSDVRAAATWTDTVRDSRNVLHWGVVPDITNSFEKASVLLISATPSLRTVWTVREAARSIIA